MQNRVEVAYLPQSAFVVYARSYAAARRLVK